jgi:dienelactone hydrolase
MRSSRRDPAVPAICLVVALCSLLTTCSTGTGARNVVIHLSPPDSLEDQPVTITVSGLQAGQTASLGLSSTDAKGFRWASSATFRTDPNGVIDTGTAQPISGSYAEASATGLIWSMTPNRQDPYGAHFWSGTAMSFGLSVSTQGSVVARTRFTRRFSSTNFTSESLTLDATGFVAQFYAPSGPPRPVHKAVLYFGGSNGGLPSPLIPGLLAAHGYAVLALAYFKEPGLPQTLSRIPLEYFAKALQWLDHQRAVDPQRTIVWGVSRGSEAALLLGVNYAALVHGVVALVPSDVALCAYPGCAGAAWTLAGTPIPFTSEFDNPAPTDEPNAVIPVERIAGPVLLDCAGQDEVWSSCPYADAIVSRLDHAGGQFSHVLYRYPDAGHGIGEALPYEPFATPSADPHYSADQLARSDLWPRILAYLDST